MDITYISEHKKFNYRVCAVIISNNKILAMHDERSPYFYLPGGRVQLGEPHSSLMAESKLFHRRC